MGARTLAEERFEVNDGSPIAMSPGTMLDDRYRLEVLLSEHGGARFWRATDTVLARNVAVHVLPSDDSRAPAVLEAARRSAGVTEQHFLRVLDCDDDGSVTWVINEWGQGSSLDLMLAQGTLPPVRAAWLAREVAEAIAAAHSRDLVHGRLNPEAVLVTDSGAVKIIGFMVNAEFESPVETSPYGELSPREADVIDLAGILYAALTGRWPGITPSAVPPAPRENNHPMRPRQVRAGVPRTLDAICDRVLHKEASQHALPIETAYEVAAALSDYVGDPAAVAPADLPSMHDEVELHDPDEGADELPTVPPPPPPVSSPDPDPVPVADPDPAPRALVDPEATMASAAPFAGIEFFEPDEWEPAAPPPVFEQPADRPLFASEERRVPAAPEPAPQPSGSWVFDDVAQTRYEPARRPRRRWLRAGVIALLVLALVAAMYAAFTLGHDGDKNPGGTTTSQTPTEPSTPTVTGTPIPVVQGGDFDPEGDPPEENPNQVPRAFDDNPSTSWQTSVYRGDARLGGLKSGVGLVLDLGSQQEVGSVEVVLIGAPTDLELYAAAPGDNDPPAELSDTRRQAGLRGAGDTAVFRLDPKVRTRYLVVWLTKLPKVAGGFQGKIAEITVRS